MSEFGKKHPESSPVHSEHKADGSAGGEKLDDRKSVIPKSLKGSTPSSNATVVTASPISSSGDSPLTAGTVTPGSSPLTTSDDHSKPMQRSGKSSSSSDRSGEAKRPLESKSPTEPRGPIEGVDGTVMATGSGGGSGKGEEGSGKGGVGTSDSHSDSEHYQPIDLVRIMVPVMLCILFVIIMTVIITVPGIPPRRPFMALTPFDTPGAGVGQKTWESLANVGIMIGFIVIMTFALLALYLCHCYKVLVVMLAVPVVMVNFVFTWIYLHKVFKAYNIPLDHVTAALVSLNFGAIGVFAILGCTAMRLQQFYLLYLCGVMATVYVQFLPDWTVWLFLGFLAIWDLIAVLTPCGPLRILVETIQEREHDFIPAMVYTTVLYTMAKKDPVSAQSSSDSGEKDEKKGGKKRKGKKNGKDEKKGKGEQKEKGEKKEKRRLRLGLGDFVFYSLLTAKAVEESLVTTGVVDWTVIMACVLAVISGLLATIILLVLWNKALPALPISIALGLTFYFATWYMIAPFCALMASQQVFI